MREKLVLRYGNQERCVKALSDVFVVYKVILSLGIEANNKFPTNRKSMRHD